MLKLFSKVSHKKNQAVSKESKERKYANNKQIIVSRQHKKERFLYTKRNRWSKIVVRCQIPLYKVVSPGAKIHKVEIIFFF